MHTEWRPEEFRALSEGPKLDKPHSGSNTPALGPRWIVEFTSGRPRWSPGFSRRGGGPVDLTADGLCRGKPPAGLKGWDPAVDWLNRELSSGVGRRRACTRPPRGPPGGPRGR